MTLCNQMALMRWSCCLYGVMLAVGRLVKIDKTIGDKVISKSTFYNTFDCFGNEREVADRLVVGELVFV